MARTWSYRTRPLNPPPPRKGVPAAVVAYILLTIFMLGSVLGGTTWLLMHRIKERNEVTSMPGISDAAKSNYTVKD